MVKVIEKSKEKSELFTESDQILLELQDELGALKDRVNQLEDEKIDMEAVRGVLQREKQVNEVLNAKVKTQQEDHREDFKILAGIMSDLKNPVNDVVNNLNGLVEEIPDLELQESLQECVDTASFVLHSFSKTEEYCQKLSEESEDELKKVHLKSYLQNKLISCSTNPDKFKLFFDRLVPDTVMIKQDILTDTLDSILKTLLENTEEENRITFKVYRSSYVGEEGTDALKMVINIKSQDPTSLKWNGSWKDSIDITGERMDEIPLDWLQCRNSLRKSNGELKILESEGSLFGTEVHIPFDLER